MTLTCFQVSNLLFQIIKNTEGSIDSPYWNSIVEPHCPLQTVVLKCTQSLDSFCTTSTWGPDLCNFIIQRQRVIKLLWKEVITFLRSDLISYMWFLGNASYIVLHSWYISYLKTGVNSPCKYNMTGQGSFFSASKPALELYSPSEMISEIM